MSQRERRLSFVGWILFIICALFFIGSAILNGDLLYLAGSIIFLVACVAFLIPLVPRNVNRLAAPPDEDLRSKDSDPPA